MPSENTSDTRPPSVSANPCAASPKPGKSDSNLAESASRRIPSAIPKERQQLLKWNGWGYNDSRFVVNGITDTTTKADTSRISVSFSGDRYPIGNLQLPHFADWVCRTLDLDLTKRNVARPQPETYATPRPCAAFLAALQQLGPDNCTHSSSGLDRLIRSHGQTLADIHALREGHQRRIPDVVVWPTSHDAVRRVVRLANEHNVAVIPFGGGTSVSGSITCPQHEERPICALDTSQMNRMLWLDRGNMVACFEAGVFGQDLERELRTLGLTVGHEPDSYEFSTLGGWVATRASGMKKNVYGNIEDLVVRVRMVTAGGEVLERMCGAPRVSVGPDWLHLILGSEGTLGVITEVVLKVRPLPEWKRYGSLVFPDFASGVRCLREIAALRLQPASIRLIDNEQFQFGQALKPPTGLWGRCGEVVKRTYLTRWRGFDVERMCVATLVFEGEAAAEREREKRVVALAVKHGGISAGAENGERGYVLTFVIAYIRDMALEYFIVAESFETSVPWDRCESLCRNTKQRVRSECSKMNIPNYLISCRVTQTYDAGAAVYFYFGFNYQGRSDPVEAYEHIENCARDEILACGGSLSHHHGVGKLRSRWYPQAVGAVGVNLYRAAKRELDPKNIFAAGNLLPEEPVPKTTGDDNEPKEIALKAKL